MSGSTRSIISATIAASLALGAGAQADEGEARYRLGETITVVGERIRIVEEVATVDVVTAEDIEKRGARTLDEAIALLPGVYVRMGADGVPRVDIRGLRTRNILLLQDGVPLNSSYDGQFDPAAVPVDNIASIKVTRGTSSMLYGPGGNAGIVEIITRAAGAEAQGSLLVEGSDPEAFLARGSISGRAGAAGLSLSGSVYDRDSFDLPSDFEPTALQPGRERVNSDRADRALQGNAVFGEAGRSLGLSIAWREGDYGKPPTTVSNTESDFANRARFERVDFDTVSAQAAGEFGLGQDLTIRPSVFFNQSNELTDGYDDAGLDTQAAAGAFREDATTEIVGGTVLATLNFAGRNLLSLSLSGREESWDANGFTVTASTGGGGGGGTTTVVTPVDQDESLKVYSAGLEAEFFVTDRLGMIAGLGFSSQDRSDGPGDDGSSYLGGATYQVSDAASLRASASRQIRFPTLRDLYAIDRGNSDLSAETTDSYEIAYEHDSASAGIAWEVVLFHIDAEDFIERVPGGVTENFEAYRFQGVELGAALRRFERLDLAASYTWMESENRSADADIDTLQNRPEHKFVLRANYEFRPGLRAGAYWLYVADSYTLSRTTPTTAQEVGDYSVLDLMLSAEIMDGHSRLYARVNNTLDELYEESFGFPQAGRTLVIGAELRF